LLLFQIACLVGSCPGKRSVGKKKKELAGEGSTGALSWRYLKDLQKVLQQGLQVPDMLGLPALSLTGDPLIIY
jgi:hypothetical protein